jgi:hypothetical protein
MAREGDYFSGFNPQVLGTNAERPEDGRIFVWTKIGWFERLLGPDGDAAFTWIARSEHELRDILNSQNPATDLFELDNDFTGHIVEEFKAQTVSFGEDEELEGGADHPEEESQSYHQHDLE